MTAIRDTSGFTAAKRGDGVLVVMHARLECIDQAVEVARDLFAASASRERLFGALTALREALLNAVLHGCGRNPELTVECALWVEGGEALMEVSDPGPGFDWKKRRLDMPDPGSLFGRGLSIMNLYAKALTFNAAGNTVKLRVDLA